MAFKLFAKSEPVPEKKAGIPMGVVEFTGPVNAIWSGRSAASLTRTGFLNNPIGFRCIKLIAESSAALDWVLQDDQMRYSSHPILSLINRPNAHQGGASFLEEFYGQILLTGNGYIEAVTNEDGVPVALHVLRSDRMSAVPGRDGWPVAYEYKVGKSKCRFPLDEVFPRILHVKSFHPQDDHYGLSPLMAAASAIDVHNAASQWSKALLDNAARPSGAIVYKGVDGNGSMSNDQYSRLVDELESNHQGAKNAGRPMLLEGGLDWKQMGFSPSDMEFHQTKASAAREISLALGVPPMLLGLPGDNTYANYQEANRAFFRLTILPLVSHLASALSHWLNRSDISEEDIELRVDMDKLPALASEREQDWRRISSADFLSDSEKRTMLGFPAEIES